ncbi:VF530 family DNA-binding protein [Chromobacterium sp. IIBBL 290-4]|uniref:VF530 family protein n=1 Tax=Chromobacterium sp. IIBBL 290-4 TaxID=2953890 RepID=UPI0020B76C44|nr:VF530 family protein [Chromobacterium sp. IIBBL 290-4]UTH75960.1 VF530 family protein [Chromobacterium sp. IIBBL 290-4]
MSHQANNPTHGVTLEKMLTELQAHFGWEGLSERVNIRCFSQDPSIKSSLTFLRRTPWARAQVEALFVEMKSRPADARPKLFGKKAS